ncbi:DUF3644 domain-containing protein [Rothia sp. P5766]|uniref:DUF3644 domain-containing protein n=1 Tax=unclassified Rothia (in: high G+C Gram-positive bacteria) TaxID=2689056 RepID=UPI003ADB119F
MEQEKIEDRLLSKSKEAFALAIELYNRPTLRYHAETCSIFLCNAWELMLKAYLVRENGEESIYYPDGRTISLVEALKKVDTNDKSPLRVNMTEVIRFRNLNTHFVTDEYEIFIGPFLQVAVTNYADKLLELHGESVSDLIPENHLALAVRRGMIEPETIRAKYSPNVAEQLLRMSSLASNAAGSEKDGKVAAIYETSFRLVRKAKDADLNVYIDKDAQQGITIVKDVKDTASYYPYTANGLLSEVNKRLKARKIQLGYRQQTCESINRYHLQNFIKAFQLKGNEKFTYDRKARNETNSSWVYSQAAAEFIISKLAENPTEILDQISLRVRQRQ